MCDLYHMCLTPRSHYWGAPCPQGAQNLDSMDTSIHSDPPSWVTWGGCLASATFHLLKVWRMGIGTRLLHFAVGHLLGFRGFFAGVVGVCVIVALFGGMLLFIWIHRGGISYGVCCFFAGAVLRGGVLPFHSLSARSSLLWFSLTPPFIWGLFFAGVVPLQVPWQCWAVLLPFHSCSVWRQAPIYFNSPWGCSSIWGLPFLCRCSVGEYTPTSLLSW